MREKGDRGELAVISRRLEPEGVLECLRLSWLRLFERTEDALILDLEPELYADRPLRPTKPATAPRNPPPLPVEPVCDRL